MSDPVPRVSNVGSASSRCLFDLGFPRKRLVFADVLAQLAQAGLALSEDEKLKTMPQGYKEQDDHEHANYLKLKSFVIKTDLSRSVWLDDDLVERIVSYVNGCQALLEFCKDAE